MHDLFLYVDHNFFIYLSLGLPTVYLFFFITYLIIDLRYSEDCINKNIWYLGLFILLHELLTEFHKNIVENVFLHSVSAFTI